MKKAQMEIMGLVVIVMILMTALLFVLFFVTKGKSPELASYDKDLYPYNTISAILQANSPCREMAIGDLLQECATYDVTIPLECGTETFCEYAESQIFVSLNNSLEYINKEYVFYVYTESQSNNYKVEIASDNAMGACAENKASAT